MSMCDDRSKFCPRSRRDFARKKKEVHPTRNCTEAEESALRQDRLDTSLDLMMGAMRLRGGKSGTHDVARENAKRT